MDSNATVASSGGLCSGNINRTHHAAESVISSIALLFNLILLYLILRHSHFKVKSYKRLLLLSCVADVWLALVVFVGQPMVLAGRGWMIIVANGFFATKSELFDHLMVATYCASIHTSMVCVVVQFFCRYHIVCKTDDPKNKTMIGWFSGCAIVYCIIQAVDATFTFVLGANEKIRHLALDIMEENYGMHFTPETALYPMMSHYTEWKSIIHHLFYSASSVGGYTIVIFCQSKIMAFTTQHGSSFNPSTRRMNQDINRALIALAITPLISLMGPSFFYITQVLLDFSNPCTAYLSLFMSLITLVNPLSTVYFVRHYRMIVMRALCLGSRVKVQTSYSYATTSSAAA